MLYTTYNAKLKTLTKEQQKQVILISRGANFPGYVKDWGLCPSKDLLHAIKHEGLSFRDFEERFKEQMQIGQALQSLRRLYVRLKNGEDIILACYEKDNTQCHRKIIGDYLSSFGIEYKELEL